MKLSTALGVAGLACMIVGITSAASNSNVTLTVNRKVKRPVNRYAAKQVSVRLSVTHGRYVRRSLTRIYGDIDVKADGTAKFSEFTLDKLKESLPLDIFLEVLGKMKEFEMKLNLDRSKTQYSQLKKVSRLDTYLQGKSFNLNLESI